MSSPDAVVVGSGPNGLAAALTLAKAGRRVEVLEAASRPGGGARTAELTEPGVLHDVCSAIHPLALSSPFFRSVDLAAHGLEFAHPRYPVAHPLDHGRAGVAAQSIEETRELLGEDAAAWDRLVGWTARRWDRLEADVLGPVISWPAHPLALARFGLRALPSATIAGRTFETEEGKALFGGIAAHSFLPLNRPLTSSFGISLGAAVHTVGWPAIRGGSERLIEAMVAELERLGGVVHCDRRVGSLADIDPTVPAVLFDLSPRQVADIAGDELPNRFVRRLRRYRHGPGVFKLDYLLSEPVPWTNEHVRGAGTVHVGGTLQEMAAAEADVANGTMPDRPFALVAQQSVFDSTRTPDGRHTLWAYAHVPHGSTEDVSGLIEAQIERFAPGFTDTILARHRANSEWFEDYNENNIGGDIAGGSHSGLQLIGRPRITLHPYRTPNPRLWLCSSSTPPGGGVHGMCGFHAARDLLRSGPLQ